MGVAFMSASAMAAAQSTNPALIAATAEAAVSCVLAANKAGADKSKFAGDADWVANDGGSGIRHSNLPVSIEFPEDPDGVARTCEVRSNLASQDDQKQLLLALEVLLKKKPMQQSDSAIWMFNTKVGPRGLQVFPDKTSTQPQIRFIGAAF